ncbi:MAG TPA: hypothetical protein VEM76_21310 [Anaeromyxobacteraceae bacterium]|nr:hypothetical protein [Anaeromyxobacteraceae bacterium]
MSTAARHASRPCFITIFEPTYFSASSRTARAGDSFTICAVVTARAMSSFDTPSCRALSKWCRKHGSQLAAIAAPMATSSWTASL